MTAADHAAAYVRQFGMAIVPLPPRSKRPTTEDWGNATLTSETAARQHFEQHPDENMGVALGASRLCSFDVDDLEATRLVFEEFGWSLDALRNGFPSIQGRPGGFRCMFRVPEGVTLKYHALTWPKRDGSRGRSTVFELRASDDGQQRQDVLPPSIHPDTGQSYIWLTAPDPAVGLPVPPDFLLRLWGHWDALKPQLQAVCPWATKAQPKARSKQPAVTGRRESVIDAYVAANDIEGALSRYGYARQGRRWLSPHSTTGLAGVSVIDGKAFIHHASDPLCTDESGQPVDAFDLFAEYEHGGDKTAAMVAAALLLGIQSPPTHRPGKRIDEHRQAIEELNQQHALTMVGDKVVVLRETVGERHGKELLYLTTGAFRTWYMNRSVAVETTDKEGKTATKYAAIADLWLKSKDRRQYEGVTFAPSNNAPACYYNLWSGFAVERIDCSTFTAAMKCRRLLSHMKYILCRGNRDHFRYLLAWSADMLQSPDQKKGVALVMRGSKGTGKSTFTDALSSLLGRHAIKVSHMRHLTGNFNRHLADKLLVVAEESYWAGDKTDEGPLKDMITSSRMTIEAKGIDAVEMPSLCRVAMVTNNEWAAPASSDERRYFVLDVSDRRRQDFDYFAGIERQLAAGGLSALLTLLLRFPLESVNLRKVPETGALRAQRALSLEPHHQFIFDALSGGSILRRDWDDAHEAMTDAVYDAYIDAAKKRGKSHLLAKEVFSKKFIEATGATVTRARRDGHRVHLYRLPPWHRAADHFRKVCRVDVVRAEFEDEGGYAEEPPF